MFLVNNLKKISKETGIPLEEIKQAIDYDGSINFDFIKTVEDARENFFVLDNLLKASFDRWNILSLADLAKADTEEEVWEVFEMAPPESEAKEESFKQLVLMNNKVEKLIILREEFDDGSEERRLIIKKICRLFEKEEGEEEGGII